MAKSCGPLRKGQVVDGKLNSNLQWPKICAIQNKLQEVYTVHYTGKERGALHSQICRMHTQ